MKILFKINLLLAMFITFAACNKEAEVASVTIEPSSVEMKIGETFQLKANVEPAGVDFPMEWISGNAASVTVDNGQLTAVAAGTSKIILFVGDKKAECMVTVLDDEEELKGLKITSGDLNLLVGDTKKLAVELDPAGFPAEVVWASTDEKIVSVSQEGVIEAKSVGEVQIKALSGNVKDEITVKVSEPVIESISLLYDELVLDKGAQYQMIAYVRPESFLPDLKWKTSDNNVATVDADGMITAVGVGEADITAYVDDVQAVCKVTVKDLDLFILVTRNLVTLHPGAGYQLEVTVDPVEAIEEYGIEWKSADESIATVSENGTVTAVGPGTTRVTATVAGKSSYCTVGVFDSKIKTEWTKYEHFDVEGYGEGMVIKVNEHFITVMAYEFSQQKWALDASVVVGNGETAYFDKDGIILTQAIGRAAEEYPGNFPLYDWVKSFGEKWYIPSPDELNNICSYYDRQEIDEALKNAGKDALPETVWSSAETRRTPYQDAGFWKDRYVVESSKTLINGSIALLKVLYK